MKLSIDRKLILLFAYFVSIYLQISILHYACLAGIMLLFAQKALRGNVIYIGFYSTWILLLVFYIIVSSFWASYSLVALNSSKGMLEFALIGPALFYYYVYEAKIDKVIEIVVMCGVILSLLLLVQVPVSQWGGRLATSRYAANSTAVKVMQSALCALGLWRLDRTKKYMLGIWLFLIAVVLLTGSRTMLAGVIVGSVVIFILDIDAKNIIKPVLLITLAIVGIYYLYELILDNPVLYSAIGYRLELLINSLFGTGRTYGSDSYRYRLIDEAVSLFKERPVFGWGPFMFQYESPSGMYYSHNNYVEILANFGLVGAFLYYIFFLVFVIKGIKVRGLKKNRHISIAISLLLAYLVIDFGTVNWYREYSQTIFTIIAAIIMRESKGKTNRQ